MPESRTFGATFETCRQVAEAALLDEHGVIIKFLTIEHGSLEETKKRARSFQTVFTALRARARKMGRMGAASLNPHADITEKPGPYDGLICQTHTLPNNAGHSVGVYRGAMLLDSLNIVSASTGEPLSAMGRNKDERIALLDILERTPRQFTYANGVRLFELDADLRADFNDDLKAFFARFAPHLLQTPSAPVKEDKPLDLADLDMDINPFTGEKEVDEEE